LRARLGVPERRVRQRITDATSGTRQTLAGARSIRSTMSFRVVALSESSFAPLFDMSDEELAARGAVRRIADRAPGFPCRVSLRDAEPGETVVLANFEHLPVASPFRSRYAIYVRRGAVEARPAPGEVPAMLRSRLLSVRAFDDAGMLVDAEVVDGRHIVAAIERLFRDSEASYLHVHFARPGCYAARIERG
jgi:hypothetical protein